MSSDATSSDTGYRIWAADKAVYGPVELPMLVSWIKEERVLGDTWIFTDADSQWRRASEIPELQMFFNRGGASSSGNSQALPAAKAPGTGEKPGVLRRIKLLAELTDEQLARFSAYLERVEIRQWTEVVKQGTPGNEMYFILEGELRVRMIIGGKESVLATLPAGEFFGDMALFDDGPRSADVIANTNCILLKMNGPLLEKLRSQEPDVATFFLFALAKSLASRIRGANRRFRDSVSFARSSGSST